MIKKLIIVLWWFVGIIGCVCGAGLLWGKLVYWYKLGNIQGIIWLVASLVWFGGLIGKVLWDIYTSKDNIWP